MMAEFHLAASVWESGYCACWITVTLSWLTGTLEENRDIDNAISKTCAFLTMTSLPIKLHKGKGKCFFMDLSVAVSPPPVIYLHFFAALSSSPVCLQWCTWTVLKTISNTICILIWLGIVNLSHFSSVSLHTQNLLRISVYYGIRTQLKLTSKIYPGCMLYHILSQLKEQMVNKILEMTAHNPCTGSACCAWVLRLWTPWTLHTTHNSP